MPAPDAISRPRPGSRSPTLITGICLFLALITCIVFGQTRCFDFVNFDDDHYVYRNNTVLRGLTAAGIATAFSLHASDNWVPLTTLSHEMDCQFYGLKAGGHHATNVALHAITTVLLFLLLLRMTGALWRSAFVAAVFAIHPLRAESVAWVSERKDVLCGLFFMLTLLCYTQYATRLVAPKPGEGGNTQHVSRFNSPTLQLFISSYILSLFFLACALMSSPVAVTLPVVLLLLDYWPLKRLVIGWAGSPLPVELKRENGAHGVGALPGLLLEKLPFLTLSAAACIPAFLAETPEFFGIKGFPLHLRVENAFVSYVAYIGQMVYPANLAAFYPYPVGGLLLWKVVGAILVLIAASLAVFHWRRKYPYLLIGWLWYLVTLLPHLELAQTGVEARADHHTYLPLIGLVLLLTWLAADLSEKMRYRRFMLAGLSIIVLAVLALRTRAQTAYWRDSETLWRHALACTSNNALALCNLSNALLQKGRVDEAISRLEEASKIWPGYSTVYYYNLGCALLQKAQIAQAIIAFQRAIKSDPGDALAYFDIGNALFQKGQVDEAIIHFKEAIKENPDFVPAHTSLGNALIQKGRVDEAIIQFQEAIKDDPHDDIAHNDLGNALVQKGQVGEAIDQFRQALKINPRDGATRLNLGNALLRKAQMTEAIAQYQEAVEDDPGNILARMDLANALLQTGQVAQAIAQYQESVKIDPENAAAHNNLGAVLFQSERVRESAEQYEQALKIAPDNAMFQNNLARAAWMLATSPDPSIRDGRRALDLAREDNQLAGGSNPFILRALAAALAATGQFQQAIDTTRRALASAMAQQNSALLIAVLQQDIVLYRAGSPVFGRALAPAQAGP